jgi:hypothetical protein
MPFYDHHQSLLGYMYKTKMLHGNHHGLRYATKRARGIICVVQISSGGGGAA